MENQADAVTARNAEIGLACLARAVYGAAHHRNLELFAVNLHATLLDLLGNADQVDAGAAAGRARDNVDTVLRTADRLQNRPRRINLLDRIVGQGNADGITYAERQQAADTGRRFDRAHVLGARLGHAEVERIMRLFMRQQVGLHGVRHGRRLDRNADVVKAAVIEQPNMVERGLDHRLGRRAAELLQNVFFHRAGVDADADRDVPRLGRLHDRVHAVGAANVAGVKADFIHARLDGGEREPVVKMDIRHDRDGRVGADFLQRLRRLRVRHGAAHNVAAGIGQRTNLRQRCFCVAGVRVGHGLHRNRRTTTDRHVPHHDLFGLFHVPAPPIMIRKISCPVT